MSSGNNNDNTDNSVVLVIAIFTGALFVIAAFFYALLVFSALIVTVLCLCAWKEDLTAGNYTLASEDARAFVARGVLGATLVPVFVLFCALLFGFRVQGETWMHLALGGYAFGSLGIALIELSDGNDSSMPVRQIPAPPPPAQIAPPKGFIPHDPAPFRFARWDDEEERS